jgi:hypothetical protein
MQVWISVNHRIHKSHHHIFMKCFFLREMLSLIMLFTNAKKFSKILLQNRKAMDTNLYLTSR